MGSDPLFGSLRNRGLTPYVLRAPAKLNLYLRVIGKRPDGYHEIETLFERIDLADELTIEPHPDQLFLTCDAPELSCGEDNLILKAARLLQRATGTALGARLHLVKRIPIAAGLGGGSSDAAATLIGLNQLWALAWDRAQLAPLAAALGSDVPFFLGDAPWAIGRGRGEVCEPLDASVHLAHVLVVPPEPLSTKKIYAGLSRARLKAESRDNLTATRPSLMMIRHAFSNGPAAAGLARVLWNDLEPEAIRRCPVISLIQKQLHDVGCLGSRLSGSGPAVFGLCHDARDAQRVADAMRRGAPSGWRIEVVQTDSLSLSPTGE